MQVPLFGSVIIVIWFVIALQDSECHPCPNVVHQAMALQPQSFVVHIEPLAPVGHFARAGIWRVLVQVTVPQFGVAQLTGPHPAAQLFCQQANA